MTLPLARRERLALCDLALDLGPDAPTLCTGWTVLDLFAHLVVREHSAWGAVGIAVPPLAPLTERAMRREEARGLEALVERVRRPRWTPYALPGVEVLANTAEYFVHHEDVRRAQDGWSPRDLTRADEDALWSAIKVPARLLVRPAGVPVRIVRSDRPGQEQTLRGGAEPVVVTGRPSEITLLLFGREHAHLDLTGPAASVAALRGADLGA